MAVHATLEFFGGFLGPLAIGVALEVFGGNGSPFARTMAFAAMGVGVALGAPALAVHGPGERDNGARPLSRVPELGAHLR